jgi:hypothetical protein
MQAKCAAEWLHRTSARFLPVLPGPHASKKIRIEMLGRRLTRR